MSPLCRSASNCLSLYIRPCYNSLLFKNYQPCFLPQISYGSDKCGSSNNGPDNVGSKGTAGGNDSSCQGQPSPSSCTMYDARKYGYSLPGNNVNLFFDSLRDFPSGVFRATDNEVLGLGACKCGLYKNPEYFSFHHMTFYDMHLLMRSYRQPSPNSNRKP